MPQVASTGRLREASAPIPRTDTAVRQRINADTDTTANASAIPAPTNEKLSGSDGSQHLLRAHCIDHRGREREPLGQHFGGVLTQGRRCVAVGHR